MFSHLCKVTQMSWPSSDTAPRPWKPQLDWETAFDLPHPWHQLPQWSQASGLEEHKNAAFLLKSQFFLLHFASMAPCTLQLDTNISLATYVLGAIQNLEKNGEIRMQRWNFPLKSCQMQTLKCSSQILVQKGNVQWVSSYTEVVTTGFTHSSHALPLRYCKHWALKRCRRVRKDKLKVTVLSGKVHFSRRTFITRRD